MVFHCSLSDSKSPQVSRTLLSILADLNNATVWMVSTHLLISKSFGPCAKPLVTVLSTPITIGITVTFMFHSFFSSLARSWYLSLFFCWLSLSLLIWWRLNDLFVSQNPRQFCASQFLIWFFCLMAYQPLLVI